MIIKWFNIFNEAEFIATGLVSREYTVDLDGIGNKTILAVRGFYTSILYEDVLLSINMNDKNPFVFQNTLVYLDEDDEVWLGILSAS